MFNILQGPAFYLSLSVVVTRQFPVLGPRNINISVCHPVISEISFAELSLTGCGKCRLTEMEMQDSGGLPQREWQEPRQRQVV
jgi:hypothetical protein